MANKFEIYWYQKNIFIKNAFLFNCRDNDLHRNREFCIKEGEIVEGSVGYVIAEHNLLGFGAKIVRFKANRKCHWQDLDLPCMAHRNIPSGSNIKSALRHYQYAVAKLPNEEAVKIAVENRVPVVVTLARENYVNLELSIFEKQGRGSSRRARLI